MFWGGKCSELASKNCFFAFARGIDIISNNIIANHRFERMNVCVFLFWFVCRLDHIRLVMSSASMIANLMTERGVSVLIHCSDGACVSVWVGICVWVGVFMHGCMGVSVCICVCVSHYSDAVP